MRSVFYGVLLTVFVAGAGYVQAANDQDYISISDEPAFKPKSTVYSDKKKKTKSSTGDDYRSISDEPAFTPKPSGATFQDSGGSPERLNTTRELPVGAASAGPCGKNKQLCRDGLCKVSCESSEGLQANNPTAGTVVRTGEGSAVEQAQEDFWSRRAQEAPVPDDVKNTRCKEGLIGENGECQ